MALPAVSPGIGKETVNCPMVPESSLADAIPSSSANAGVLLVVFLARVVGLTALPLGIALLATQPLVRLAQTRHAHSLSAGPPDIEALD